SFKLKETNFRVRSDLSAEQRAVRTHLMIIGKDFIADTKKKFTIKSWRYLIVTNEDGSGERYFESDGVKAVRAKKEWLPAPKLRKFANVPGPSQAS
ncbi:unnamed protein product, partial [Allacma fusca]